MGDGFILVGDVVGAYYGVVPLGDGSNDGILHLIDGVVHGDDNVSNGNDEGACNDPLPANDGSGCGSILIGDGVDTLDGSSLD